MQWSLQRTRTCTRSSIGTHRQERVLCRDYLAGKARLLGIEGVPPVQHRVQDHPAAPDVGALRAATRQLPHLHAHAERDKVAIQTVWVARMLRSSMSCAASSLPAGGLD